MRKIISLVLSVFLLSGLSLYSQGFGDEHEKKIDKIKKELNLTKDQESSITKIMEDFRNSVEKLRIDHQRAELDLKEELIKDNPNQDNIKLLIKNKSEVMNKIEFLMIKRDLDIKAILTKEQFDKWRFMLRPKRDNMRDPHKRMEGDKDRFEKEID